MRLIAWRLGTRWTAFHIASFGKPLCGRLVPDALQRTTTMDAKPEHWRNGSICRHCRAAVQRSQQTEPAGSEQADGGRNEPTSQAGLVAVEATAPAGNEQSG